MPGSDCTAELHPAAQRNPSPHTDRLIAERARLYLIFGLSIVLYVGIQYFTGQALALSTQQHELIDNAFTTTTVVAPENLAAVAQGHDVQLVWSSGQFGSAYAVLGAAIANGDCLNADFSSLNSATDLGYLDRERYEPPGSWFCYQVVTTRGNWNSQQNNPAAAIRLGFFVTEVQLINGGDTSACGTEQVGVLDDLDCGDQIIVSFNQAVDTATGPGSDQTVCADQATGTIWLGSTGSEQCTSSEEVQLGKLSGGTIGRSNSRLSASYHWQAGDTILIVTVGAQLAGDQYPSLAGSNWTFEPSIDGGDLLSAYGAFHVCDTNLDGDCLPAASWTSGDIP